jgi:hypothetical protein
MQTENDKLEELLITRLGDLPSDGMSSANLYSALLGITLRFGIASFGKRNIGEGLQFLAEGLISEADQADGKKLN